MAKASFAATATKKANLSEEAVAALLPVWSDPTERQGLYYDNGYNAGLEMTRTSAQTWNSNSRTREAVKIDKDQSANTGFGFGIFAAGHGADNQIHLYVISHQGQAVITGPADISAGLRDQLKAAGAEYVSQKDIKAAATAVDEFVRAALGKNVIAGADPEAVFEQKVALMYAFCFCETIDSSLTNNVGGRQIIPPETTIGKIIAVAGDPGNVMYTVDLDQPGVQQANKMVREDTSAPTTKAKPRGVTR